MALTARASNQGLLRKDAAAFQVYDGLVRVFKLKSQALGFCTTLAILRCAAEGYKIEGERRIDLRQVRHLHGSDFLHIGAGVNAADNGKHQRRTGLGNL